MSFNMTVDFWTIVHMHYFKDYFWHLALCFTLILNETTLTPPPAHIMQMTFH